jgi:flavodoxin
MNPIIFYYSNEGSTAKVAEGLAQATGGELRRLTVAGLVGPGAIFAAMLGLSARLVDTDLDVGRHDVVVLMTPVWAGVPTPASNAFIRGAALRGRPVYFVTVGAGDTNPKAVAALEKRLASRGATVIGHTEVRGKMMAMARAKPDPKAAQPMAPDPTDEDLAAAGAALAADVTAALAAGGAVQ